MKVIFICTGNTCRSPMAEGFAKYYNIKLTPSKSLHITLRRFKTNPALRSKRYSQRVYSLNIFGVKEIALRQKQKTSRQNNKKTIKTIKTI